MKHIHILGICGTAMASFAGLLQHRGYKVTGSDKACYPPMSLQLKRLGISARCPYSAKNLEPRPDLIIFGNVVSRHFNEVERVLELKIPYKSFPEALFYFFIQSKQSVVIAGTHGKTTTTALMAWIFECLNKKPSFLVGGIPQNFNQSFLDNKGDYFIVEGDEYDTAFFDKKPKFFHYKPKYLILTGVEFDHADIYQNVDQILSHFKTLIEGLPSEGILVANSDDKNTSKLIEESNVKASIVTYGFKKGAGLNSHYHIADYEYEPSYQKIVVQKGKASVDIQIPLFGHHNILNTVAVYALCAELFSDQTLSKNTQAFKSFEGVKRRQEVFFEKNNVIFIDDFAHHPTAVKLTIESVRKRYFSHPSQGRLIAIFEPRSSTSRRQHFQEAYAQCFDKADHVIVAPPYDQSHIQESDRFSSHVLVESLRKRQSLDNKKLNPDGECFYFEKSGDIVEHLKQNVRSSDVVLIMSNGGFDDIYDKIKRSL